MKIDTMKYNNIKLKICETIKGRYNLDNNSEYLSELLSLADEKIEFKEILRIKRNDVKVNNWKTLVLVQIEAGSVTEIKFILKKTISWIASIKESLFGTESTDLYLFLAFTNGISKEECLRIESTEQFCRKYVLMPDEEIAEFINRTFLQEYINDFDTVKGQDPLERAFSKTFAQYSWLTPEIQKRWKKAFLEVSGSELFDEILKKET